MPLVLTEAKSAGAIALYCKLAAFICDRRQLHPFPRLSVRRQQLHHERPAEKIAVETRLASSAGQSLTFLHHLTKSNKKMTSAESARRDAIQTLLASPFWNIPSISPTSFTLYNQALTHSSFAQEQRDQGCCCEDNERLEFLGDRILNCAVANFLYHHYDQATPQTLSDKIKVTQNAHLAHLVKTKTPDIKSLIRLGNGQSLNDAILADTFEALIAAIYLDPPQGLPKVHRIVNGPLASTIEAFYPSEDYISHLQIYVQKMLRKDNLTPDDFEYLEVNHYTDNQNNHTISYEIRLNGKVIGQGSAITRKQPNKPQPKQT